jgi:hypothetical protein
MSNDKTNDPAHHGDHKDETKHDEHSEHSSGKHKEKGSGPGDAVAPADDDIIIK